MPLISALGGRSRSISEFKPEFKDSQKCVERPSLQNKKEKEREIAREFNVYLGK